MRKIVNSLFNLDARRITEIIKKPIVDAIITSTPSSGRYKSKSIP